MVDLEEEKAEEKEKPKRINIVIPPELNRELDNCLKQINITKTKLIRDSVEYFIKTKGNERDIKCFSTYTHELKVELSSIKGFSQMLIDEYKNELSWDVLLKIKEIYDKSVNIERILNKVLSSERVEKEPYDVLIVDDDYSTLHLLSEFFNRKGVSTRNASSANETLDILQYSIPKLILLDISLTGAEDGYEICKKIRSDKRLKKVPIYYITAVPETEVYDKIKETGANGYLLKPFNMVEFNDLLKQL